MTGMTSQDLGAIIKEIDVEKANCWSPGDKTDILDKIRKHHGSTDAFNEKLRLQLMLNPVSYKIDLEQLGKRSKGTSWDFTKVEEWLAGSSRCLCIMGGAGTGKSTLSAALSKQVLGLGSGSVHSAEGGEGAISAIHFLKYSDQRRLEPVRIIKSLAFQLALNYR